MGLAAVNKCVSTGISDMPTSKKLQPLKTGESKGQKAQPAVTQGVSSDISGASNRGAALFSGVFFSFFVQCQLQYSYYLQF